MDITQYYLRMSGQTIAMNKIKILLTEGDSWTAGDIIDPKLEKQGITNIDHRDNDAYRLPKVWPHKLSKLINVKSHNTAHAGSSNDGIEKRVIGNVGNLLKEYKPEDIFVIVGWSSPERKDFYYNDDTNNETGRWETLYPAQLTDPDIEKGFDEFAKSYATYFWNKSEYIMRYMVQNINIHTYLLANNIKHVFFDAFYETLEASEDRDRHGILDSVDLIDIIKKYDAGSSNKYEDSIKSQYLKLYETNFIKTTFKQFIDTRISNEMYKVEDVFHDMHPTELSHQKWANYLGLYLNGQIINDQVNVTLI